MTRTIPNTLKRVAAAGLVGATALSMFIGASSYQWSVVGKDDRPASVADCRKAELIDASFCNGVKLPATTTEAYQVMPGLSIIEQVESRG